ncbi:MAG: LptF/LptG family permease [Spirochaetaceae bacterium]|nr:LptF/LptG family permease [Spirochaetaceae bacterium]MBO4705839.1 LptF/LptG family permease [Spirochaetaceae bacterium]
MTLVKYLFKKFIPTFIVTMLFFSIVLCLVDLFMHLWEYIQNDVSFGNLMRLMLLYVPKTLWYAAPLSMLFAVAFTLSMMYSNNELTVICSSGVSLFKFTLPLLIVSVFLSVGFFFFEDYVVVPYYKQKVEFQNMLLKVTESKDNNNVVIISDAGLTVYKADYYDDTNQRLYGVVVVTRNEDRSLSRIVYGASAAWNEDAGYWKLSDGVVYRYSDGNVSVDKELTVGVMMSLHEPPETFRNFTIDVEEVNTTDALAYIDTLKRVGLPYGEPLSVYYKKFAFPSVIFLVVLLSIGLTGRSRKNVLLSSLILCVSAAVAFYVTQMVTMYMAKFEYLSPLVGAWGPVGLFLIISIALFRSSRT